MAIAVRGSINYGNTGATTNTTITVNKDAGVVSGDVILIFGCNGSGSTTFSCPGFSSITAATGTSGACQLLYRVADGSESSTFTVTQSVTHNAAVACIAFSGVDNTTPIDASPADSGQINASGTSIACASITTTANNDELIWFGWGDSASGTPATVTVPSGFTAQGSQSNTSTGSGTNVGLLCGLNTQATAGATGAANGTLGAAHVNGAGLFALQPATGPIFNAIVRDTGFPFTTTFTGSGFTHSIGNWTPTVGNTEIFLMWISTTMASTPSVFAIVTAGHNWSFVHSYNIPGNNTTIELWAILIDTPTTYAASLTWSASITGATVDIAVDSYYYISTTGYQPQWYIVNLNDSTATSSTVNWPTLSTAFPTVNAALMYTGFAYTHGDSPTSSSSGAFVYTKTSTGNTLASGINLVNNTFYTPTVTASASNTYQASGALILPVVAQRDFSTIVTQAVSRASSR